MKPCYQRQSLALSFLGLGLILLIIGAVGCRPQPDSLDLVILHVNDTHGHLLPYDDDSLGKDVAGIARRATLIKKIRKNNKGRTLVLHAGDAFSRGDPLASFSLGEANMKAMESAGYDAFVPGEGEFYFSVQNLKKLSNLVRFPTLAANIFTKRTGERIFEPYIIKRIAGVDVAVLGLGKVNTALYSGWPLVLQSPLDAAREFLPLLEGKADIIVALTHQGSERDRVLAEEVHEIDVIVGGDDHIALDSPLKISHPASGRDTVIVHAGQYGLHLGRLDVSFQKGEDGRYRMEDVKWRLIPVGSDIAPDPDVERLLGRYEKELSEVICVSKVKISNVPFGPSPMRALVTEAIRAATGADVALLGAYMSSWSVRGEIHPGPVNLSDVYRVYNFGSNILVFQLTGAQLIKALTELQVHVSGCHCKKTGDEIVNCKIEGEPLQKDRIYRVAVDDPLLAIESFLYELPFREARERVDTAIVSYLKGLGVIEKAPQVR